ncbi:MAG: SpoIID/LytB domain-containing protein [bacterium]|nr:SpoIID/LytB domain-containing protein [bacterium]
MKISIGLLWNEPDIRGTLNGEFSAQCFTECNRWLDHASVSGELSARANNTSQPQLAWAVRLGECWSKASAERILNRVPDSDFVLRAEILEAGRQWESKLGLLDNRVWWPVIRLTSRDQAGEVIAALRATHPIGLTLIRLTRPEMKTRFELRLGEFAATVVRVKLAPLSPDATFTLQHVPIGRGFHWERREPLTYRGELELFATPDGGLSAANRLPLEEYVETAVGSEMRHDLPAAFSQAQAVAARSTVLATANRHHYSDGFDLCHDDHCQCYQGIVREADAVIAPIRATSGHVLIYQQRIADARYAKSCGGASDLFVEVWGEEEPGCFAVRPCGDFHVPDLSDEQIAAGFLKEPPHAFCNPQDHPYPKPWDEDELFRWTRTYDKAELGALVTRKTNLNIGAVEHFTVKHRSPSGRITILELRGSAGHATLYGELEIRRALSPSHLPSSYFVTHVVGDTITLEGGGWGHGVGLCQLGAVAMAQQGWTMLKILAHYYPGAELRTL